MKTVGRVSILWVLAGCVAVGCSPGIPGEVIGTTEPFSSGLDQTAERLYWHTDDAVWSMPKAGGEPVVVAEGQRPTSLRVAGSNVCWMNHEGEWAVRCIPLEGGEVRTLATQPDEEFTVRPLATDGESLFWSTSARKIRKVPLAGGEAVDFAPIDAQASSVAAEPGAVYASNEGGVVRFNAEGGEPTPVAGGAVVVPDSVTLSNPPDEFVYWTETGFSARDGLVLRARKDGGDVVLLARRQTLPSNLYVDGEHVYWATGGGTDRIRRIGTNGGREEDFAGGKNEVGPPVVDGENVYWIDPEGSIHRAPK